MDLLAFIRLFQSRMPAMSATEREAIEAGDVWWEKDLFSGRPDWKKLLQIPSPKLSTEEENFLNNQVNVLCEKINDWKIVTEYHDLPEEVWNYLKQERFLGMIIPKQYGGLGFSALAHSNVIIKVASRSVNAAINMMVPNSLGPAELLLNYGTEEQKNYYLPRLARGEEIPCFALTGPEAGSDAAAITDSGIICRGMHNGKEIIGIKLNWDKRYITLAPIATVIGLAFRLYDPENLMGDQKDIGITLCLVPSNTPGVQIGTRHYPVQMAFMNGPTRGRDVFIPLDWIIGGKEQAGQGWRMLMECLSIGRSISLPALSAACAKVSYKMTGAYASLRRQFNNPIAAFEGVEAALAEIAGRTYLIESCRIFTASAIDLQIKPAIASAVAKYHMTEMARKIIYTAMDIHAGQGIQAGPRNRILPAYFTIPISITVEGANILTRNFIIFGQGVIRCHPYLWKELQLLSNEKAPQRVKNFNRLLFSHIGYFISNVIRNWMAGITGGRLLSSPVNGETARYYRQLSRMSLALALLADIALILLAGNLKRKERLSARLGDMLSFLYLGSAVMKYFHDQGEPKSDLNYLSWSIQYCLNQIQIACDHFLKNLGRPIIAALLRFLIFPFGRPYNKPNDLLDHLIVQDMLKPNELRDRLTHLTFISQDQADPLRLLETAFIQWQQTAPLLKKFQNAIRNGTVPKRGSLEERVKIALQTSILNKEEAHILENFHKLYREVIKVDEFSFDLSRVIL